MLTNTNAAEANHRFTNKHEHYIQTSTGLTWYVHPVFKMQKQTKLDVNTSLYFWGGSRDKEIANNLSVYTGNWKWAVSIKHI